VTAQAETGNIAAMAAKKRIQNLDWDDVRYFVALARAGSLSAAARTLRVNHATVARRVANLETLLGRPLFDRRADGYTLNAEGKAVLDEANVMDEAALAVLRRLDTGAELKGLVRLTTTRVLADGFLVDHLRGFRELYPSLDLELVAETRILSLARREADIALRLGQPADSELVGRRIARVAFGFYAAARHRDAFDSTRPPPMIGYDEANAILPEAVWLAHHFPDARLAFRSNSQTSQAAAARAGFGIAMLPHYLAAKDPKLTPVRLNIRAPERDLWLLTRRDLVKIPRVRAVTDYLVDVFRRNRRLLTGR